MQRYLKEKYMATFFNQATLTYNNTVTTSNIVSGEIIQVLYATKTAVSPSYSAGESITYAISILNSGTTPFSGLTVSDDLGAYEFGTLALTPLTYTEGSAKYYINGTLQATVTPSGLSPLTFTDISVPAGGNAFIIYEAQANQFAPLGTDAVINNTITISGTQLSSPITAEASINPGSGALLSISKDLTPLSVPENGQITYTFVIRNTGNAEVVADDNAIVTDVFDPAIDITSVNYNGAAWAEGTNYTYDGTTGAFATLAGQISVPAATFSQDATTGEWTTSPGIATITVTGTV